MGRIKTRLMKRVSVKIFNKHNEQMTTEFEQNKKVVSTFVDLPSKKMRNVIAGYITRLKRAEQRR